MTGLPGLRRLMTDYKRQSGRDIVQIRVSHRVPADHCYAGRFNGGPHEVVLGEDARDRLLGPRTRAFGVPVIEEAP